MKFTRRGERRAYTNKGRGTGFTPGRFKTCGDGSGGTAKAEVEKTILFYQKQEKNEGRSTAGPYEKAKALAKRNEQSL